MATEKRLVYAEDLLEQFKFRISPGSLASHSAYLQIISDCVHIARKIIEEAPTVDAVEVVRCKDCKYSKLPAVLTQKYGAPGTLTCHNRHSPSNKRNVKQYDFCPYGERRIDNAE